MKGVEMKSAKWDLTKKKPNKKLRLAKCPKCGRTGKLTLYKPKKAGGEIKHKGHYEKIGNWTSNIIDESCLYTYDEVIKFGLL